MKEQRANKQKAIIYCRVSSKKQTKGSGLHSQEHRCREYARMKGYAVIARFDDDLTGKLVNRPGMQAMLDFVRQNRADNCVVLIDDISRLARDVEAHWELRRTIIKAGGRLESPSVEFKQDADSRMVENVLAGAAQHQREKNAEQTLHRMRARLTNGFWPFAKPKGYRYEKSRDHGKVLVRDEPVASILTEALEGYASGRFETQVEVKRFLESQPDFPKCLPSGEIRNQRVHDILTQPLYAGYLEAPKWDISFRKARHEGLIGLETYQRIQKRLAEGAKAPARKDLNEDFTLRGFVVCGDCGHPLTACWSKSSTGKKYPYYLCHSKGCASYRKSIPRKKLEGEFETLLHDMQPTETLFDMAKLMFTQAWEQMAGQQKQSRSDLKREIGKTDKQIDQLLDRIIETDNGTVIAAYEAKIAKLEKSRLVLQEKQAKIDAPKGRFDEMFELAMQFLSNPWKLWASEQLNLRRIVLRLGFAERIAYTREEGFSNVKKSFPFKLLEYFGEGKKEMARWGGFEPPTPRFVVWCSIQLSYQRLPSVPWLVPGK